MPHSQTSEHDVRRKEPRVPIGAEPSEREYLRVLQRVATLLRDGFLLEAIQRNMTLMILEELSAVREVQREERERCAKAALAAKLPPHYRWGRDAMEQFEFGKKRAADAIMGVPDA